MKMIYTWYTVKMLKILKLLCNKICLVQTCYVKFYLVMCSMHNLFGFFKLAPNICLLDRLELQFVFLPKSSLILVVLLPLRITINRLIMRRKGRK